MAFTNDEKWAIINWVEMDSPFLPDGGTVVDDDDKLTVLGLPLVEIVEIIAPVADRIEFLVDDGRFNFKIRGV